MQVGIVDKKGEKDPKIHKTREEIKRNNERLMQVSIACLEVAFLQEAYAP
jgi:hypothetical protein